MHDRAARLTGAIKSAVAIAAETMILLNIDLRIAQVRPRVEESVQRFPTLVFLLLLAIGDHEYDYQHETSQPAFATGLWSTAKTFEVATNMLVIIMESSEK